MSRKKEMKEREYLKQLQRIREEYHSDIKDFRFRAGVLQENQKIQDKTYLVRLGKAEDQSETEDTAGTGKESLQDMEENFKQVRLQDKQDQKILEKKHSTKGGVKFEINLDVCVPEEESVQEAEVPDKLSETLTFVDGGNLQEKLVEVFEDHVERALEELSAYQTESNDIDDRKENRKHWQAGAPQTLLKFSADADLTSVYPAMAANELADRAVLPEDIPRNRKQWKRTPPGTLLNVLVKAELSNDSFIHLEEEIEGRLTMLPPKANKEDDLEPYSAVTVDEGRLEPRSDDEDTKFEDSDDELRHELQESLEKVAASPAERITEPSILSVNKGQADEEKMSLPCKLVGGSDDDDLENNHGSFSVDTHNEKGKQEASAT
uniref:Uncharacterized protein n=2 Tax=Strigops habroptila TaxID=2489341 RepID=A0A672TS65_STRHB